MNLDWLAPTITAAAGAIVTVGTYIRTNRILRQQEDARRLQEDAKRVTDEHTEQLEKIKQVVQTTKENNT